MLSCRGCRLNRLDQVRAFVFDDVPHYDNVEFKPIQGAPPQLVLLTDEDKEVNRIDLAPLNRQECNELLLKYGFRRRDASAESPKATARDDF
ncbi:selenoprotein M-like [Bacillus rossius redtenbacheri]|uniref:selenoprotein M-like n=1 Tax=Bacillus rossius redtenbacheri TaxID=93214 RepID=UPI002FDD26DA